jgi:Transposase IS66 family
MIWWFYRSLKEYKLAPSPQQAEIPRARFDRIFKRGATGYVMLDRLLRRLFRHKDALLRVLERPKIPLNTNASENDIRAFVTKRKISGGTVSHKDYPCTSKMLHAANAARRLPGSDGMDRLIRPYGAHGGPAVWSLVAHLQRKALAVVGLIRPGSFEGTRTHIAASLRIVPA